MEGSRGARAGCGGGVQKLVERIKDPLVGILGGAWLKARLWGNQRGAPSTAQGQRINALQASLGLDLPSPLPLRAHRSRCLSKCCLRMSGLQWGLNSLVTGSPQWECHKSGLFHKS